jgi:hypothetical protein
MHRRDNVSVPMQLTGATVTLEVCVISVYHIRADAKSGHESLLSRRKRGVHDGFFLRQLDLTRSIFAHRSRLCSQHSIHTEERSEKSSKKCDWHRSRLFNFDDFILYPHRCRAVAAADLVSARSSEMWCRYFLAQVLFSQQEASRACSKGEGETEVR